MLEEWTGDLPLKVLRSTGTCGEVGFPHIRATVQTCRTRISAVNVSAITECTGFVKALKIKIYTHTSMVKSAALATPTSSHGLQL